jgi:hypothetical protein
MSSRATGAILSDPIRMSRTAAAMPPFSIRASASLTVRQVPAISAPASLNLREHQGFQISLVLQVDALCHRIPRFIEKAARAGCRSVFIGIESIDPESLTGTKKHQNKIGEYRAMLQGWRRVRVSTHAGYILGFPSDTPEGIARDVEIIKKELPVDLLEFFLLTPLPGSEDHKNLYLSGARLEPDMNKYDLEHLCTEHPRMTPISGCKPITRLGSAFIRDRTSRRSCGAPRRAESGPASFPTH